MTTAEITENTIPTIKRLDEITIPPDLHEQIARLSIRKDELNYENQHFQKIIEFYGKETKTLELTNSERMEINRKKKGLVEQQAEILKSLTTVKAELRRLNTLKNELQRIEAARKKDDARRREYNRQFTNRMRRIWENKGKKEAMKRIENENKEFLGEIETQHCAKMDEPVGNSDKLEDSDQDD